MTGLLLYANKIAKDGRTSTCMNFRSPKRITYLRNKKMNVKKRHGIGFTLVEMLVVILIITMLATLLAPRIFKGLGKAKMGIARSRMALIEDALARFYLDCGLLPDRSEGLNALLTAPPAVAGKWDGPYLKPKDLIDPWGHPFEYRPEGTINEGSFDLISYGADGVQGGEGENADVYND